LTTGRLNAALAPIGAAVLGRRKVTGERRGKGIARRRGGQEPDRAAFGTVAIERALRPAQHFDPFDVGQPHIDRPVAIEIGHGDRHVVEIEPDGRGARGRADPADDDIGAAFFPATALNATPGTARLKSS
jgi:hypothetical protein